MEQIYDDIYKIIVPLPENPLKNLNCYLILGERNLLIDSGFNCRECYEKLTSELNTLDIDMDRTDLFITHGHGDHYGLTAKLKRKWNTVFCSRIDGGIINSSISDNYWNNLDDLFTQYGFARVNKDRNVNYHPGKEYNTDEKIEFNYVDDNTILNIGKYNFKCIETPGHSPGHVCLYEKNEKILFSGDHILQTITPHISIEQNFLNSLDAYLKSLELIKRLDIEKTFPSHREDVKDIYQRSNELIIHHKNRLAEILNIMGNRTLNAYEVAEEMAWDTVEKSWKDFPIEQKWFAMGESIAHLVHLYNNGSLHIDNRDNIYYFTKF